MGSLLAGPALNAAHSQPWKFLFFQDDLTLPRDNSCLSCICCSCQARRATCLVAAHGAALAACAALLRRPSTPFVAVRSLSSAAPSWREHCAEFERGRHAEPRGPLRHAERRVRTPCDSCGFLGVFSPCRSRAVHRCKSQSSGALFVFCLPKRIAKASNRILHQYMIHTHAPIV